jgi:hypothetical protein
MMRDIRKLIEGQPPLGQDPRDYEKVMGLASELWPRWMRSVIVAPDQYGKFSVAVEFGGGYDTVAQAMEAAGELAAYLGIRTISQFTDPAEPAQSQR